jgi:hypothetical protein
VRHFVDIWTSPADPAALVPRAGGSAWERSRVRTALSLPKQAGQMPWECPGSAYCAGLTSTSDTRSRWHQAQMMSKGFTSQALVLRASRNQRTLEGNAVVLFALAETSRRKGDD